MQGSYTLWFEQISIKDIATVGGKNASLGEMYQNLNSQSIKVPNGFATTAEAFWDFVDHNKIRDKINAIILDFKNSNIMAHTASESIQKIILKSEFSPAFKQEIQEKYSQLISNNPHGVAIRSSATAEDLPTASFAGQLESFLNINGVENILSTCKKCFASLFTARALSYRASKNLLDQEIAISVGIQSMIRSDLASSGVIFTLDTETGFRKIVTINASWGLGENIVQGKVNPDEYLVFKPLLSNPDFKPIISKYIGRKEIKMIYSSSSANVTNIKTSPDEQKKQVLSDSEILTLARWAEKIENHYQMPMDIEWAKDGSNGELYIVQARPETVQAQNNSNSMQNFSLEKKSAILTQGLAIGSKIISGKAQIIESTADIAKFKEGSILITQITDPDWVPIMKKASGIITNSGGRTSHAAIVSRELGLPVIVGTGDATEKIKNGQEITLSCAEGSSGFVYEGLLPYKIEEINLDKLKSPKTKIMLNLADPDTCFKWWRLPSQGVGLARIEFIINNIIKIHPMALVKFEKILDRKERKLIEELTAGYLDRKDYFIDKLGQGIAKISATAYPNPAIIRFSDFKSNEYARLIGGQIFEEKESNPMLGFRGASRYYSPEYIDGFKLECQAIKYARDILGFKNIAVMIPFCRTISEAQKVLALLDEYGLSRGQDGLEIYMMAEIPSNIILADDFAKLFDGFSIGSNDLTQLTLGVDRDSDKLAEFFDETDPAVLESIKTLIQKAHNQGAKIGICGQAPSDKIEFAEFLINNGIDSISLNPDSVPKILFELEKKSLVLN
jgi:pyruvate,water dikinase